MRALDQPAIRELRRYRSVALLWIAGAIVAFVPFTFAATAVEGRAEQLEKTADRVPGRIETTARRSLRIAFEYRGVARTEGVSLDDSSPAYRPGQEVTVLVDPADPEHFSIVGETNQSPVTVWPMIALVVGTILGLVTGVGALIRAWRQKRLLRRSEWNRFGARYTQISAGLSLRGLLLLQTDEPGGTVLTVLSVIRWRLPRLGLTEVAEVDVAGALDGYVVVRAPGASPLVSAHPPLTDWTKRRWRRAFS